MWIFVLIRQCLFQNAMNFRTKHTLSALNVLGARAIASGYTDVLNGQRVVVCLRNVGLSVNCCEDA